MIGYKAFTSDMLAMNDVKFSLNEPMHVDGIIKSGPINGNGFHFCVNFEDTFRFVPFDSDIILCEVMAYGTISKEYTDEYNGYYGIYSCSDMNIKRIISRKEIIQMASILPEYRLARFIQTYKLNYDELKIIREFVLNNYNLNNYVEYYQLNNKSVFNSK